ncbi:hypothetical protein ACIOKD_39800 [Streptomyces sp. NPDC087844]|uniref:hypothetical protein n=1 Tax=Streptomyces sp. NPDC087844 TaxID=3365805 RepID=UPI00382AE99F
MRYRENAGGFSGWKLRVIEPDVLPEISKKDSEGKGVETFGYFEPKPYHEYIRTLYYDFTDDPGTLIYNPANGAEHVIHGTSSADQKGSLRLPHHGYVTVAANGRWRVSVR